MRAAPVAKSNLFTVGGPGTNAVLVIWGWVTPGSSAHRSATDGIAHTHPSDEAAELPIKGVRPIARRARLSAAR